MQPLFALHDRLACSPRGGLPSQADDLGGQSIGNLAQPLQVGGFMRGCLAQFGRIALQALQSLHDQGAFRAGQKDVGLRRVLQFAHLRAQRFGADLQLFDRSTRFVVLV